MLARLRSVVGRDAALLLASMGITTVPVGALQVALPLYLNRTGLDPALIGLLYTVSGLVTATLVAVFGVLADRFGRRPFIVGAMALPILSYAIFASTTDLAWLVVASVLGGVGLANGAAGALSGASFDALLAEHTPSRQRTRAFTWAQALWSLALAAGAATAALPELLRTALPGIGDLAAYRPLFLLAIVLAAVGTVVVLPVRDLHAETAHKPGAGRARSWLPRRSRGPIARYSLGVGFLGLGLGVVVQLMPLWFHLRFGVEEAALGSWYALAQLLSLSSVVLSPWLERRVGGGRGAMLAQTVSATCLLLIAFSPLFTLAAGLFVVRSIAANVAWPLQQSLLMGAVLPEERATAAGVGFSVWGFLNALGPGLGGALLAAGSLLVPPLLGAACYALAGAVFGLGFRTVLPHGPPSPTAHEPEPVEGEAVASA